MLEVEPIGQRGSTATGSGISFRCLRGDDLLLINYTVFGNWVVFEKFTNLTIGCD